MVKRFLFLFAVCVCATGSHTPPECEESVMEGLGDDMLLLQTKSSYTSPELGTSQAIQEAAALVGEELDKKESDLKGAKADLAQYTAELQGKVSALAADKAKLKDNQETLGKEDKWYNVKNWFNTKVADLKSNIEVLEGQINDTEDRITKLEHHLIPELEAYIKALEADKTRLTSDHKSKSDAVEKAQGLEQSKKTYEDRLKQKKKELADAQDAHAKQIAALTQKHEKSAEEARQAIESIEKDIVDSLMEQAGLSSQKKDHDLVDQLKAVKESHARSVKSAIEQVTSATDEHVSISAKAKSTQDTMAIATSDLNRKKGEWEAEIKKKTADLEADKARKKKAEEDMASEVNENEESQETLKTAFQNDIKNLRDSKKDLVRLKLEEEKQHPIDIANLKNKHKATISEIEDEIREADENIKETEKLLEDLHKGGGDYSSFNDDIHTMDAAHDDAVALVERAKGELENILRLQRRVEQRKKEKQKELSAAKGWYKFWYWSIWNNKKAGLENDIKDLDNESERLDKREADKKKSIKSLEGIAKGKLQDLKNAAVTAASELLANFNKERDDAKALSAATKNKQALALSKKIQEDADEIATFEKGIANTIKLIQAAEKELDDLNKNEHALDTQLADVRAKYDKIIGNYQKTINNAKAALELYKANAEKEKNSKEENIDSLKSTLQVQQKQTKRWADELKTAKDQLKTAQEERDEAVQNAEAAIDKRKKQLEEEVKKLREDMATRKVTNAGQRQAEQAELRTVKQAAEDKHTTLSGQIDKLDVNIKDTEDKLAKLSSTHS